jgi:ferritin-like metal-binding protein YciE
MKNEQLHELLLQSLEHERGGIQVYQTALECVVNDELEEEFEKYLGETQNHARILEGVFAAMKLDTEAKSPGRKIVHELGASLVKAMKDALAAGDPAAAELVACECVVLAETKDHQNWELLSKCAEKLGGDEGKALKAAVEEVEDQEDEHLYHSKGWCRELWMKSLGLKSVLPPPEERKHVKTAIGAARAEQQRDQMR